MRSIATKIENSEKDLKITFEFKEKPNVKEVQELFLPGKTVSDYLIKKGFISKKGTVLVHFESEEVFSYKTNSGTYKLFFHFYQKPKEEYSFHYN